MDVKVGIQIFFELIIRIREMAFSVIACVQMVTLIPSIFVTSQRQRSDWRRDFLPFMSGALL